MSRDGYTTGYRLSWCQGARPKDWRVQKRTIAASAQKAVLWALVNRSNADGTCYARQQTIAEDACMTRQSVNAALQALVEQGFLAIEEHAEYKRIRSYRLLFSRAEEPVASRDSSDERTVASRDTSETRPVAGRDSNLSQDATDYKNQPSEPYPQRDLPTVGLSVARDSRRALATSERPRDPIWETLYVLETGEPYSPAGRRRLTRKAASALNAAAREIRETGITEAELRAAIAVWPHVMGDATCTAHAVAKHLPRLLAAVNGRVARRSDVEEAAAEAARRLALRGAG